MSNLLEYKGYYGDTKVSIEDGVVYGKVLYINDLVTYEADLVTDIQCSFETAVDDYLRFCAEHNREPNKSFKGSFNVRITPELHKNADLEARKRKQSLNQFVSVAIENEILRRKEIVRETVYVCAPVEIAQKAFLGNTNNNDYIEVQTKTKGLSYSVGIQNNWIKIKKH